MARLTADPTGRERMLGDEDIIVSKTDLSGRIQYVNQTFLKISSFTEREVLGQPHSMVRHPDVMPRCVFKLLWDTIQGGHEIFAYVCNLAKNGDHYWVFAHVTPSFSKDGSIVGYHSNRRCPDRNSLKTVMELYKHLIQEETRIGDRRESLKVTMDLLQKTVTAKSSGYDEFIHTL
jgi:PAS domain S-box-containing protein